MAEEEGELLNEMIAQNQQMNLEMEKKRNPTKISQAQKNMQVLSNKAGQMASKVGSKVTKNGIQSPLGHQAQNTMINLNNVQKVAAIKNKQSRLIGPAQNGQNQFVISAPQKFDPAL